MDWLGLNGLALYGALVGTVGLGLSLYLAFRDRAKLKVFACLDDTALDDFRGPSDRGNKYLVVARNEGRRTVAIQRVWYRRRSTGKVKHLLTDRHDQGTQLLEEGRSLHWELDLRQVPPTDLKQVVLETQDGRRWKGRFDASVKRWAWND